MSPLPPDRTPDSIPERRLTPPEDRPRAPSERSQPEAITDECAVCGTSFGRHPDDPPACSPECEDELFGNSDRRAEQRREAKMEERMEKGLMR